MVRQAINEYEMWADPEMGMEAALKVVRQTFLMHLEAAHQ
jgi:hypothetical protein